MAWPLIPNKKSEVVITAKLRLLPNADKRRIIHAAARAKPAELGARMRREGVYSPDSPAKKLED